MDQKHTYITFQDPYKFFKEFDKLPMTNTRFDQVKDPHYLVYIFSDSILDYYD